MCEVDVLFQALSDRRRRYAVCCLQKHHTVPLADLAEFVAERERGTSVQSLSPETVRDVYFSLYHNHVPMLEEADLADYEQDSDVVGATARASSRLSSVRDCVDALLDAP